MQQQPESSARRRASSSSACSTAPRRTTIGCMAGLLRLFSPYHRSHHRKRLTAKNNPKQLQLPSSPAPTKKKAEPVSSPPPVFLSPVKPKPTQQQQPAAVWRRRSCDTPRSPTIAPEHRRSSCDSPRPPSPAIVARLMGLEESAPPSPAASAQRPVVLPTRPPPPPPPPAAETAAEKQRKLLDALEKCDEDLKTLRRIIATVHAAEMRAAAAAAPDVVVASVAAGTTTPRNKAASAEWLLGRRDEQEQSPSPSPQQQQYNKDKPRGEEQYPSPDSVLDIVVSSPRFPCRKRPSPSADHDAGSKAVSGTTKTVKPSRTFVFSGEYCKTKSGDELPQPQTAAVGAHHHHPAVPAEACTLPARAESWRHHRRRWDLEAAAAGRVISRATAESVGEVWGQQRAGGAAEWECGWVAAALERVVLQDMVYDVVAELLAQSGRSHGAGCRKRLLF